MSLLRIFFAGLVLIGGILATHAISPPTAPPEHQRFRDFPSKIDVWHSKDLPYDPEVVKEIGADDYTNREYFGGSRPIELYIGYYKDQRSGDVIHSPKNCLPGSGWEPVRSARIQIGSPEKPVTVNEYVVQQRDRPGFGSLSVPDARPNRCERVLGKVLAGSGRRETPEYGWRHGTRLDYGRGWRRECGGACDGLCSSDLSASFRISSALIAVK